MVGVEALLRWNHPMHGRSRRASSYRSPRSAGLIHTVGDWVLREACTAGGRAGRCIRSRSMSRRCSSASRHFVDARARHRSARAACRPNRLELEVTESVLLDAADIAARPCGASRGRRPHRARRFRHRLLIAQLSAQIPGRQDQDRPLVRAESRHRRGSDAIVAGDGRTWPGRSAWRSRLRASRRRSSATA